MKLKIRDMREDHDPTRQETADRCGATSLFIPNMSAKNGTVLCFLIVKLASSSNASVEYLIGRTGEKRAYRRV